MMRLCALFIWGSFVSYVILAVRIASRMMKEGKRGPPVGLAAFDKDSYTAEGQRLLGVMWRFVIALPLVMVGILLLSALLCNLLT